MDIVTHELATLNATPLMPVSSTKNESPLSNESTDPLMQEVQLSLQGELWIMKMLLEKMMGREIKLSEPLASNSQQTVQLNEVNIQSLQLHAQVDTIEGEQFTSDFLLTGQSIQQSATSLSLNQQAGGQQIVDPLVINLARDFADLDSAKFHFDLNMDGQKDWVPQLKSGSAFLALDKNGNQKIDDGNELFGPQSGDGFADLARFDDNKDGKIDKNDALFEHLKVWRPNGQLLGLVEVGVTSISLHAFVDEKQLHSESGKLLGIARKSGEFTRENGQLGRMQHIDMVI